MKTSSSRSSRIPHDLSSLVGAPCAVTRFGQEYEGRGTLRLPGLDGHWLRAPEIGKPLWLVVGVSDWVRTSPVISVKATSSGAVVVVRTEHARYRFVFRDLAKALAA